LLLKEKILRNLNGMLKIESLEKIIKKGLNPDKTKRYKNIDELTDDVKYL